MRWLVVIYNYEVKKRDRYKKIYTVKEEPDKLVIYWM